ncbi:uncharacterized protein LOC141910746 isoform X2 [Tubulanus polymorphus]|uniref:uncharacterized protein LOC141910746 isoform X2 n=1 Tax=Tubulanus polymorphus TaxID=672921 RepID=UPI003DA3CAC4
MSPSGHTLVDTNPRCCSCRVSKANNPSKAALSTSTWLLLVSVLIVGLIFTNICWFTVYRCLSNRVGQLSIDVRRFSIRESSLSYGRRRELQPKFAVDDASELDDDDEQMTADEVFLAAVAQETDSSLDRLVGSSVSMGKTRIRRSRSDGGARSVRNRKCKRKLKRCINQLLSKGSSRGRKGCKNKSVKCRRNRRGGRGRNCCPRRRPKPRPRKLASPIPVHTSPTPALTSSTSVSTSPISTHKPSQERVAFPPNLLRSSSALKMHYNRRIVAGSNLITVRKKAGLPSVTAARPRETGRGILQPSPTHLRRRHKRNVRESGFRVFGNTDRCNLAIGKNRELCEKTLNYGVLLPWKFVRKEVSTKFGYDVRTDMVQIRYPGQYIVYANVSYLEGDGSSSDSASETRTTRFSENSENDQGAEQFGSKKTSILRQTNQFCVHI